MPKKTAGFTLIELLLAMGIMTLLFGLGYSNYRDFSRRQQLESAYRELYADLRQAQQNALTGDKPEGCVTLNGYQVRWNSATSYVVEALCTNETYQVKVIEYFYKNPDINFQNFSDIIFNVLAKGANATTGIVIQQNSTGETRQITVTSAGEII